jgi:hypothetical protein
MFQVSDHYQGYIIHPLLRPYTHLDLAPNLRINGAIPLFPLYVFMAWTGTISPLPCTSIENHLISNSYDCHILNLEFDILKYPTYKKKSLSIIIFLAAPCILKFH